MKYSKKVPIHHDSEDYYVFRSDCMIKDYHTPSLIDYNPMIEDFNGIVEFYKSGKLKYRTYYEAGMKHRVGDGPAAIWYGKLEIIPYWYLQNENKTYQVNLWLEERDIHWQNMTKTDYLVMWPELEITYHDQKN